MAEQRMGPILGMLVVCMPSCGVHSSLLPAPFCCAVWAGSRCVQHAVTTVMHVHVIYASQGHGGVI